MLPPNAHWKGFLRFGLIRLRSISSHGTDHASPHGIAQHSQIPILTGSIRQTSARRQYIAQRRTPFPGLAIFWERHHAHIQRGFTRELPCKDKALNTYGARAETVSIPTRTSSRRVRRKRKLGRPLTRKGLGSKGPVNTPGSIRTLHQFWALRGSFRAVKVAAAFKDQRRSIHIILRPPRRQIEAVKEPLRVDSTEEHTGDVPPEPPTRLESFATAAELPAKYTDTKDPTFSENSAEIHRQHILTREILTWLRNPEVRNGNNANSLQQCPYKKPPTQLTVMDRVSPTILHRTQREEPSLARPSEAVGPPFLLPSLREPSIYANSTGIYIAGLQVAHLFEHPALPESGLRTGDPVKRDITPNHRTTNTSALSSTTPPSFAFHKAVPDLAPPLAPPLIDGPKVMYWDVLDGLQLGLSAILDSDVDFCVKEVVGANARRFLADIAALGELRGK
ncbi:hypothetical protein V500_08312 [Pseudogymnoascus sp. VKM F-4518 (FW-2643)]|nr:hypothetical protein V500_08312 [Pseudogymnoascus sp. VKM F-4518 (FW-2643)]